MTLKVNFYIDNTAEHTAYFKEVCEMFTINCFSRQQELVFDIILNFWMFLPTGSRKSLIYEAMPKLFDQMFGSIAFFLLLFKEIAQVFSYIINRILGGEEIVDVFCTFACDICTETHYCRGNLQDY